MLFDETITDFLMELDVPLRQVPIMTYYVSCWAELEDLSLSFAPLTPMVRLHFADQLEGFHQCIFTGLPLNDVLELVGRLNGTTDTQDALVLEPSAVDPALMSAAEHAGYLSSMLSGLGRCFDEYQERWGQPFEPFVTAQAIRKEGTDAQGS